MQNRIILLTDGAHNEENRCPVQVAGDLKAGGICIDVIGIGGSPADVDARAPQIASKNPDGTPRYCFISDSASLIKEFKRLSNRIKRMDDDA